jgi:thioredoxin 1
MNITLNSSEYPRSPHPEPYLGAEITKDELKGFIKKTTDQGKQPIVVFGANWCPDAKLLEGVMQLTTVKDFLDKYASVLNVDVGKYQINTELFSFFDSRIEDGIPRVFVMNLSGQLVNLETNDTMRKARELSAQEIFDYFQGLIVADNINSENV